MSKKRHSDFQVKSPKLTFTINHAIVSVYVLLMFMLFPFFLTNYYGNARRDKFWFFVILTAVVAIAVIIISIANYVTRNSPHNKTRFIYYDPFKIHAIDIAMLAFLGITAMSTIFAVMNGGDFTVYLIGSNGRNMGLLTIFMLTVSYFIVSRLFYCKKYIFLFIMIGMAIMSFLAIVNYYYIDPLGLFEPYADNQSVINDFTSTIGNKNYLSAMICIALPYSVGMVLATKDKLTLICSYISVGLQFIALIVATSDGGFLGCFLAFAVMLIIVSKNLEKLSKLFACFAIMIISSKLLWLFDILMDGNNKGYTSFSEIFIYENFLFILIPVFVGAAIVFAKLKDENGKIAKCAFVTSIVIISLVVVIAVALFIYFSVISPETEVNEFTSFFRFNEDWGTHRGFFWINAFEAFKDFDIREVLFGTGPDSFKEAFSEFNYELRIKYGESYTTAAHSVYINYLITIGVLGVIAYIVFIAFAIKDTVKFASSNPIALVCVGAVIAYAAQDIVNIANPVNTPWFILMIALAQSVRLRANSTEICEKLI